MIGAAINGFLLVLWLTLGTYLTGNPFEFIVAILISIVGAIVCLFIDASSRY